MLYQFRKAAGVDLGSGPGVFTLLDATDSAFLLVRGDEATSTAATSSAPKDAWAGKWKRLRQKMAEMLGDAAHLLDTVVLAWPIHLAADMEETVRQAATESGLDVVEVLPAPVAAAVYHAWMNDHGDAVYLLCQLGESMVTGAVVRKHDGNFALVASEAVSVASEEPQGPPRTEIVLTCCRTALERAEQAGDLSLTQVDYVTLAGATSLVASVQEALTQALESLGIGRAQVLAQEADICIACGTALRGALRGRTYQFGTRPAGDGGRAVPPQLEVHLAGLARTRHTNYSLVGTVRGRPPHDLGLGASVRVEMHASGVVEEAFLKEDGSFSQDLELVPDVDNPLSLTVCDVAGRELVVIPSPIHHAVRHERGGCPGRLLTRSLQLEALDNQHRRLRLTVAPARAVVPGEFSCPCRTADQSGKIVVPIWEDDRLLQTVTLSSIPPDLPVGSAIEVRLRIEGPGQIEVIVTVRDLGRTEVVALQPGPASVPVAADAPLQPAWPAFARLVKHCLILAGDVANQTGRDRAELFEEVYAQERYGEQAYQEKNRARYQECVENLGNFLYYLEQLARQSPGYSHPGADIHEVVGKDKSGRDTAGLLEVREQAC
jgi:hypothetical protein